MTTASILDTDFHALTMAEVVDWAADWIRAGRRGWLCTVNVAVLMTMRREPRLRRFVGSAALTVADGQPIVWLSRLLGRPLPERVAGIDLVDAIAARAAREGFSVFLLGGQRDVVRAAATELRHRHPGLVIAGLAHGYFGPAESAARARAVRASGARILLVGMGVPRQEHFLEERWADLGVNLAIGIGGSLEVLAGRRRRAPRWCQRAGCEWLYRLAQEPKRLGRRYVLTNSQFVCHAVADLARAEYARWAIRTRRSGWTP